MPIAQFAALAIAPGKPCKRDSSVDSSSGFSDSSFEAVLSPLDMGFFDSPLSPLPPCTLAPALARSLSFVDTYSLRVKKPSHYADFAISPLSSALDFLNWVMGICQLPLRFWLLPPSWYSTTFICPFQAFKNLSHLILFLQQSSSHFPAILLIHSLHHWHN